MYSQNNEEAVLLANSADTGHFLDIGAYDGVRLSNVRALAEKGWTGVMVEPSPLIFTQLMENYRSFPEITLVNSAIIPGASGPVAFHDSMGDAISSSDPVHLMKWHEHKNWQSFWIRPMSTDELFNQFGYEFDIISVDVEGQNLQVLKSLPLDKLSKLKLLCVEYDEFSGQMISYMESFGFILVHRNAENIIFQRHVKEEKAGV
jgi:FkbM family methyltransferase